MAMEGKATALPVHWRTTAFGMAIYFRTYQFGSCCSVKVRCITPGKSQASTLLTRRVIQRPMVVSGISHTDLYFNCVFIIVHCVHCFQNWKLGRKENQRKRGRFRIDKVPAVHLVTAFVFDRASTRCFGLYTRCCNA